MMLVLARHVGEEIIIDGGIRIKVLEIAGSQVRIGIEAPREVGVYRREVYEHIAATNQQAAQARPELLLRTLGRMGEREGSGHSKETPRRKGS